MSWLVCDEKGPIAYVAQEAVARDLALKIGAEVRPAGEDAPPHYTAGEFAGEVERIRGMFNERGDIEARMLLADEILKLREIVESLK